MHGVMMLIALKVSCCVYGSVPPTFSPRSHWIRLPLYHIHMQMPSFFSLSLLSPHHKHFKTLSFWFSFSSFNHAHAFGSLSLCLTRFPFNFTCRSLIFSVSCCLCLSSVSLPHSRIHNKHTTTLLTPAQLIMPCLIRTASITTTVLTHTHITHTHKHTQRGARCRLNNMLPNIHENR